MVVREEKGEGDCMFSRAVDRDLGCFEAIRFTPSPVWRGLNLYGGREKPQLTLSMEMLPARVINVEISKNNINHAALHNLNSAHCRQLVNILNTQ